MISETTTQLQPVTESLGEVLLQSALLKLYVQRTLFNDRGSLKRMKSHQIPFQALNVIRRITFDSNWH